MLQCYRDLISSLEIAVQLGSADLSRLSQAAAHEWVSRIRNWAAPLDLPAAVQFEPYRMGSAFRRFLSNLIPPRLSFRTSSVSRRQLHSPTMRLSALLEDERKMETIHDRDHIRARDHDTAVMVRCGLSAL